MLRITYDNTPQSTVLTLEGRLSGVWVNDVARTWLDTIGEKSAKKVTVDLSDVTFVDVEGKKLLRWMFDRGAKLSGGHLMTKYIVDQVAQEAANLNHVEGDSHAFALRLGPDR